jgi:hypothetical protein
MRPWCLPVLLVLVACAPFTSDAEYLTAYAQAPRLNAACVGESGRPGPQLEFGANVCTLVVYPTDARDARRAEHYVTLFYRQKTGNLFRPSTQNRTRKIEGESPISFSGPASANFPMYVPDRNFFRQAGRIAEGTFKLVLSLAPAALGNYLGLPIPPINLEQNTKGLWADVERAINDLVNATEEPYALEVSVRICGPRLCSPLQTQTLKLP